MGEVANPDEPDESDELDTSDQASEGPHPSLFGDDGEDPNSGADRPSQNIFGELWEVVAARFSRERPVYNFAQANQDLDLKNKKSDLTMRKVYAGLLLIGMFAQVAVADWLFFKYMQANEFNPPVEAMQMWVAATVVQIIGLVIIVTRSLFPNGKS